MKPRIFIHTNQKQIVGALVSQYSFTRFAEAPDAFSVELIETNSFPWLAAYEGKTYLRDGLKRQWLNDDLQSFTVLRFMPPALMGFQGRALVVDPDVFCVANVGPLLDRDMKGKALLARHRTGGKKEVWASSVMLLDNPMLTHWKVKENFEEMFTFRRDYMKWVTLQLEPEGSIGPLEAVWNDFDQLTPDTRMIHNTKRQTQPWKTGLPIDFRPPEAARSFAPKHLYHRARRAIFGDYGMLGALQPAPRRESGAAVFRPAEGVP